MQATKESNSFDKFKQVEPENVTELANCNHWESKNWRNSVVITVAEAGVSESNTSDNGTPSSRLKCVGQHH